MEDYKALRKRLIVTIISLVLVATFLVLAVTSFCWFSQSKVLYAGGMKFAAYDGSAIRVSDVRIFKRDGATGARDVTNSDDIYLTEYDTVFTDKNVNTPLIVRAELSNLPQNKKTGEWLDLNFTVYWDYGSDPDSWFTKHEEGNLTMEEILSNIAQIKCYQGGSAINALTDPEDIYKQGLALLSDKPSRTFIDIADDGSMTKSETITFTISDYEDNLFMGGDGFMHLVLYIDIDYFIPLIDKYVELVGITVGEDLGNDIMFFNSDISDFYFVEAEKE